MTTRHNSGSDAYPRAIRFVRILTMVAMRRSGSPLGREELALACGCDKRTIQRDINHLTLHVPLEYDKAERAYVLSENDWKLPVAELSLKDALALALLRGLVSAPGLLPEQKMILAALDKAAAGLAPDLRDLMNQAADAFTGRGSVSGEGPLLAGPRDYGAAPLLPLLEAVAARRTLRIDYESRNAGARDWRLIDPYAVLPRDGIFWELYGWCHKNAEIRTFALDRVYGVESTETVFTMYEAEWGEFQRKRSIGGVRGGEAISVHVRFSPQVAVYARERRWPQGLRVEMEPDGSALLLGETFGMDACVVEVLRWRRHAQVLGGTELRARLTEEVRAMAALYSDDGEGRH